MKASVIAGRKTWYIRSDERLAAAIDRKPAQVEREGDQQQRAEVEIRNGEAPSENSRAPESGALLRCVAASTPSGMPATAHERRDDRQLDRVGQVERDQLHDRRVASANAAEVERQRRPRKPGIAARAGRSSPICRRNAASCSGVAWSPEGRERGIPGQEAHGDEDERQDEEAPSGSRRPIARRCHVAPLPVPRAQAVFVARWKRQ